MAYMLCSGVTDGSEGRALWEVWAQDFNGQIKAYAAVTTPKGRKYVCDGFQRDTIAEALYDAERAGRLAAGGCEDLDDLFDENAGCTRFPNRKPTAYDLAVQYGPRLR